METINKEQEPIVEVPRVRSFKHAHDVEGFYRFVFENNLRHEAKTMFEHIFSIVQTKRKRKSRKLQ